MNIITDYNILLPPILTVIAILLIYYLLNLKDPKDIEKRKSQIEILEKVVPVNTKYLFIHIEDLSRKTGYDLDKLISWYCKFSLASGNDFVQMHKFNMFQTFIRTFYYYGNTEIGAKNGIYSLCQMFCDGIMKEADLCGLGESIPLGKSLSEALDMDIESISVRYYHERFTSNVVIPILANYFNRTLLKYKQ